MEMHVIEQCIEQCKICYFSAAIYPHDQYMFVARDKMLNHEPTLILEIPNQNIDLSDG